VDIGSGAKRNIEDVKLSRYACYLIVQNADPSRDQQSLIYGYSQMPGKRRSNIKMLYVKQEERDKYKPKNWNGVLNLFKQIFSIENKNLNSVSARRKKY